MNTLQILKAKLGITSNIRDTYLQQIINGIEKDLIGKGINIHKDTERVNLLIVDMAYKNYRDEEYSKNIEMRIKDLIVRDQYGSNI